MENSLTTLYQKNNKNWSLFTNASYFVINKDHHINGPVTRY